MTSPLFSHRLELVWERIRTAALRVGRDPAGVRLVAVSKTHPTEALRAALDAGQCLFGESYAQELVAKHEALANVSPAPEFHFIGGLQSRKVRALMGRVSLIHSVDRIRLLQEIDRHAGEHGMVQDVLLEVNTGGEETKSGCAQEELPGLLDAAASFRSIRVLGLMAIPPWDPDPEAARPHFQALRRLRDTHAPRLPELSMGMSHDLEVAVEEGATLVRVGTALFGSRLPGVP